MLTAGFSALTLLAVPILVASSLAAATLVAGFLARVVQI
jgi:hypothetical protein